MLDNVNSYTDFDRVPATVILGLTGFTMSKSGFQMEMFVKSFTAAKCKITVSVEGGTAISFLNVAVLAIRDNPGIHSLA